MIITSVFWFKFAKKTKLMKKILLLPMLACLNFSCSGDSDSDQEIQITEVGIPENIFYMRGKLDGEPFEVGIFEGFLLEEGQEIISDKPYIMNTSTGESGEITFSDPVTGESEGFVFSPYRQQVDGSKLQVSRNSCVASFGGSLSVNSLHPIEVGENNPSASILFTNILIGEECQRDPEIVTTFDESLFLDDFAFSESGQIENDDRKEFQFRYTNASFSDREIIKAYTTNGGDNTNGSINITSVEIDGNNIIVEGEFEATLYRTSLDNSEERETVSLTEGEFRMLVNR